MRRRTKLLCQFFLFHVLNSYFLSAQENPSTRCDCNKTKLLDERHERPKHVNDSNQRTPAYTRPRLRSSSAATYRLRGRHAHPLLPSQELPALGERRHRPQLLDNHHLVRLHLAPYALQVQIGQAAEPLLPTCARPGLHRGASGGDERRGAGEVQEAGAAGRLLALVQLARDRGAACAVCVLE